MRHYLFLVIFILFLGCSDDFDRQVEDATGTTNATGTTGTTGETVSDGDLSSGDGISQTDGENVPGDSCGNGVIDAGESCDGNEKNCIDIDMNSYSGGTATCNDSCSGWDLAGCTLSGSSVCGNGELEGAEACDSTSKECTELSSEYSSGVAECNQNCTGYDTSACVKAPFCGNFTIEEGEVCDKGQQDCATLLGSDYEGVAPCKSDCSGYDETACTEKSATDVYYIEASRCNGCRRCMPCPEGAISIQGFKAVIDPEKCNGCGDCVRYCPRNAIYKK